MSRPTPARAVMAVQAPLRLAAVVLGAGCASVPARSGLPCGTEPERVTTGALHAVWNDDRVSYHLVTAEGSVELVFPGRDEHEQAVRYDRERVTVTGPMAEDRRSMCVNALRLERGRAA